MNCIDFEYNGHMLSEYDCIVCRILTNANTEATDIGNQLKFNTINYQSENNSFKYKLLSSEYENPYTVSLEIGKNPKTNQNQMYFTDEEVIRIVRWLNQKKFHKFKMIDKDGQYSNIYYNGSFNVKPLTLANRVIGMHLDFTSDAPYGYYEPIYHYMDFSVAFPTDYSESSSDSDSVFFKNTDLGEYVLYDQSDEAGYIYPDDLRIEVFEDGNLAIHNSLDDEEVVIRNCVAGEIIALDGKCKIIKSNMEHKNLYNDLKLRT